MFFTRSFLQCCYRILFVFCCFVFYMVVFVMLLSCLCFSLGLIALVAGVCLFLWSVRAEAGPGIGLAKVIGIIVIILAVLELLCTVYSGIRLKNFQREMR